MAAVDAPLRQQLARQLAIIDSDLGAGRLDRARRYLDGLRQETGDAVEQLRLCLAACDDVLAGRPDAAQQAFERVAASPLPFPGVQLAAGRHFLNHGQPGLARACLARAQLCGLPVTRVVMAAGTRAQAAPELLRFGVDVNGGLDIARAMVLKHRLLQSGQRTEAAAAYAAMFAGRGVPEIVSLPLAGLRDHARAHGAFYLELVPAARLQLPWSQIVGAAPAESFGADGRAWFVAALADAIVCSRSNIVQVSAALVYDHQDEELAAAPPDFACDGQGFDRQGEVLTVIRFGKPALVLDAAISLLGCGSRNFGHWVGEFLPRQMLIDSAGVAAGVPVLVDAGMPASHREALQWCTGGSHPVVEIAPGASVQVRLLWIASTPSYTPYVPLAGTPIQNERLCAQTEALARLLAAQPWPAPAADTPRRLYLARGPALRRRLINRDAVEALCVSHGFVRLELETLPFLEQLRLVRGASHVVGPAGSALLFAFLYGTPGLKVLDLHPAALEETPTLTSIAAARGVDVLVLLGQGGPDDPQNLVSPDFTVDLASVRAVLAGWQRG